MLDVIYVIYMIEVINVIDMIDWINIIDMVGMSDLMFYYNSSIMTLFYFEISLL